MVLPLNKEHLYKEHHCEKVRLPEPPQVQIVPTLELQHDLADLTSTERARVYEEISILSLSDGYLE